MWYRLAGYSGVTLTIAQVVQLVAAAGLVLALRLGWRRIGLGVRELLRALVVGALAYGAVLACAAALNAFAGADLQLWRSDYRLSAFVDNWGLTAFAEELLFAGVIFTLVARRLERRRRWIAVVLVALLFALAHLPWRSWSPAHGGTAERRRPGDARSEHPRCGQADLGRGRGRCWNPRLS